MKISTAPSLPRRSDATGRRSFVLLMNLLGHTDHEIAVQLNVSLKTVYRHRQAEGLGINRARWGSVRATR